MAGKANARKPGRFAPGLPPSLSAKRQGAIAIITLSRPQKRDALNDEMVQGLASFFQSLPKDIMAVVLDGKGEHFSAGLDLTELSERNTAEGVEHSASWHRAFQHIEFGKVPVVA